ncbi:hypothetical protein [Ramlibacter sp.]|uniref:hypothetical protein n=1 Tax=Ramlibacter sp. TaxID=1917967 RepID=UPI003D0C09FF
MKAKIAPTTRPAPAPMLVPVGRIEVPPTVVAHRFHREALANAMLAATREEESDRVVGTENTKRPELYGWGQNVGRHVDNTGFMYLVPLSLEHSVLYALHKGDFAEQMLRVGEVVRLWDFAPHWTEDRAPVVSAFVGSFDEPCDEHALQLLAGAVAALARGDYFGAPRVASGMQILLDDECFATADFESAAVTLIADAKRQRRFVIPCAQCNRPAHVLDHHWPYEWSLNACRDHRGNSAPLTSGQLAATTERIAA